jgi:predicted DsbA family dithiol-disulfide isomerase
MADLRVLIWSDYIWPFCCVGLARAEWLERRFGAKVDWLPFDLHPEYPPEGITRAELETRYPADAQARVRAMIESAGFRYNPPADVVPNSQKALQVTELARDRGLHEPVHSGLMHAYWTEGVDIGDEETLLDLAAGAGVDRVEAAAALEEGRYAERVQASTLAANRQGVHAIPAFVLEDRLLVLGAQPEALFERAVEQLSEASPDV